MFTLDTYYALDIMIFLSLNYGKKAVTLKDIADFCSLSEKVSTRTMVKLEKNGLLHYSGDTEKTYTLVKPPYDIRLSDIIFPLEPVIFTNYLGTEKEKLPSEKARMLYLKIRPFQLSIERKLKRCRLSEWALMTPNFLYSF